MNCLPNSLLSAENTGLVQGACIPGEEGIHRSWQWKSLWKSEGCVTVNRFRNPGNEKRSIGSESSKAFSFSDLVVLKAELGPGDSGIGRPSTVQRICTDLQHGCSVRVTRIGSCAHFDHGDAARATSLDSFFESAPLTHRESRTILNWTTDEYDFGQMKRQSERK